MLNDKFSRPFMKQSKAFSASANDETEFVIKEILKFKKKSWNENIIDGVWLIWQLSVSLTIDQFQANLA